jgi:hypothetical protein
MYELSLVELESELSAELPARELMSRRRGARAHAHANNGSVANANATSQTISAPQTAVLTGVNTAGLLGIQQANAALVAQVGLNTNSNSNTQFGTPVNSSN